MNNELREFHRLVNKGNVKDVEAFLQQGRIHDVDTPAEQGYNAIRLAAEKNNFELIKTLIGAGASINFSGGCYLLCKAIETRDDRLLKLFLRLGVNLYPSKTATGRDKINPFSRATSVHFFNKHAIQMLLLAGIDPNHDDGASFVSAVAGSKMETILELMDRGVNLQATDENKRNALSVVAARGDSPCRRTGWLLARGVDLEHRDQNQNTPILCAAKSGNWAVVSVLVQGGANVNVMDDSGKPLLFYAIGAKLQYHIEMFVSNGAFVNPTREFPYSPLCHAVATRQPVLIQYLVEKGADVALLDDQGKTPLHHAYEVSDIQLFTYLLNV